MNGDWNNSGDAKIKIFIIGFVMLFFGAVLVCKLGIEQLRKRDFYDSKIMHQTVRKIRIPARRGKIFSSDMKVLAESMPGCNVLVYPEDIRRPGRRSNTVKDIDAINRAVGGMLGLPSIYDRKKIIEHLNLRPGLPLVLYTNITMEQAALVLERFRSVSGVEVEEAEICRFNPHGSMASHVIGYTRFESPAQAEDREDFFYYLPDLLGCSGMELFGNGTVEAPGGGSVRLLRGTPGCRVVRVDHLGFVRQTLLAEAMPLHGNHLVLTLDARAQKLAEAALHDRRGAFVMLDATSGAVLALASSPGYDLNEFSPSLSRRYYSSLLNNPGRPLFNRALSGMYTPGSIVKVLAAMALLENGVSPESKVNCPGFAMVGNARLHCAASGGHGEVNMYEAIERSCNTYFVLKALELGRERLIRYYSAAGLGKAGSPEVSSRAGFLPDPAKPGKRKLTVFDTALLGIGQGQILVTPLQAALFAAAIANDGVMMKPYLLKSVVDEKGTVLYRTAPESSGKLPVSPENLRVVREVMRRVVNESRGSGRRAKVTGMEIYGKTGSAEVGAGASRRKNVWFIAFTQVGGRKLAAAMMMEEGNAGGSDCAPQVGKIFEKYSEMLLTKEEK